MIITAESTYFPDAPRTFYATEEMLGDWCGPVRIGGHAGVIVGYADIPADLPATDALACALVYMQAGSEVNGEFSGRTSTGGSQPRPAEIRHETG